MKSIRVALDKRLLLAADRAAKRLKCSRSALVREALRRYLRDIVRQEQQDRSGYIRCPDDGSEWIAWEAACEWPPE